jgi:hypothetical protein
MDTIQMGVWVLSAPRLGMHDTPLLAKQADQVIAVLTGSPGD